MARQVLQQFNRKKKSSQLIDDWNNEAYMEWKRWRDGVHNTAEQLDSEHLIWRSHNEDPRKGSG